MAALRRGRFRTAAIAGRLRRRRPAIVRMAGGTSERGMPYGEHPLTRTSSTAQLTPVRCGKRSWPSMKRNLTVWPT